MYYFIQLYMIISLSPKMQLWVASKISVFHYIKDNPFNSGSILANPVFVHNDVSNQSRLRTKPLILFISPVSCIFTLLMVKRFIITTGTYRQMLKIIMKSSKLLSEHLFYVQIMQFYGFDL